MKSKQYIFFLIIIDLSIKKVKLCQFKKKKKKIKKTKDDDEDMKVINLPIIHTNIHKMRGILDFIL